MTETTNTPEWAKDFSEPANLKLSYNRIRQPHQPRTATFMNITVGIAAIIWAIKELL